MSARPGVVVSIKKPAPGGESPNNFWGAITAEVRAFWPPLASSASVEAAIWEAATEAVRQHRQKCAEMDGTP